MGRRPTVNHHLPPLMRARQRGEKTYYFYDSGGKPRKEIPLGSDYVEAVKKWADLRNKESPIVITVGYVVARYLASADYANLGAGTQADYKFAIDKILEKFADAPMDEIEPPHVQLYVDVRSEQSRHRALREKAIFSMLYNYAIARGWAKFNPAAAIKTKRLPGRKHIDISDDMQEAVYQAGDQSLRDAMDLAYYIGQRPADVLKLLETDIKDGVLSLRQNKTAKPIRIDTVAGLADTIDRILKRKRDHSVRSLALLVDGRGAAMTKAKLRSRFEKARADAGIKGEDFQFRDLRRKSGTDLREQVGIEAAQELLGHASVVMTEHYTGARGNVISAIPSKRHTRNK